jgi:alpha-amylase
MNGTMLQAFEWYLHGPEEINQLRWAATEVRNWATQGFTALWLPPANKGSGGTFTVGYDVYDLWDLGRYRSPSSERTKNGTFEDLQNLIAACRSAGVQAYADLVFNHKMGATRQQKVRVQHVDKDNKNQPLGDWHERDLHTHFRFDDRFTVQDWGSAPTNSYFEWNADHFDAVELNLDGTNYTFRLKAKNFESNTSDEHGGTPYLMGCDIDTSHPDVFEELCRIGDWMLGGMRFDGFRLDAVKHLRTTFFRDFLKRMSSNQRRKVFAVGEYWSDDVGQLHRYLDRCDSEMTLFDVPLQKHFHDASKAPNGSYDMGGILEHTLMKERPTHAVTFVQNHDTTPLRTLEQVVESWFVPLAYAIILLRAEGYPCVFYGDLYGSSYADKGRNGQGWYEITLPSHGWIIGRMMEVRRQHAYGQQFDYFDHSKVVGWSRLGAPGGKAIAVLMSNGGDGWKHMYVGKPGAQFYDHLNHFSHRITADGGGYADFVTRGGKVSVWVEV